MFTQRLLELNLQHSKESVAISISGPDSGPQCRYLTAHVVFTFRGLCGRSSKNTVHSPVVLRLMRVTPQAGLLP